MTRVRLALGVSAALIAAIALTSWAMALATSSSGSNAPQADWICSGIASLMEGSRPSMAAEQPGPAQDAAAFAVAKQRGLADLDKGIAWANRGCDAREDGGTLVPGLYQSATAKGHTFQAQLP